MNWFGRLFGFGSHEPVAPVAAKEPIKPGLCECGHARCFHNSGIGSCTVGYPPSDKWKDGSNCACMVYIFDPDADDDDDDEPEPITPTPDDLERLYKR